MCYFYVFVIFASSNASDLKTWTFEIWGNWIQVLGRMIELKLRFPKMSALPLLVLWSTAVPSQPRAVCGLRKASFQKDWTCLLFWELGKVEEKFAVIPSLCLRSRAETLPPLDNHLHLRFTEWLNLWSQTHLRFVFTWPPSVPWDLLHGQTTCVLVAQSCPALCDPMDWGSLGSSIHGILQARILEQVAISFFIMNRGTLQTAGLLSLMSPGCDPYLILSRLNMLLMSYIS